MLKTFKLSVPEIPFNVSSQEETIKALIVCLDTVYSSIDKLH